MSREHAYETDDAKPRPILGFVAALSVVSLLAFWGMGALQDALLEAETTGDPHPLRPEGQQLPPAPRLQVNAKVDLDALRAREDALLEHYAWIDPEAGSLRVPVDRAAELVLQEGLDPAPDDEGDTR